MTTISETLRELTDRLGAAGVDQPRLDARLLLAEAMGVGNTWLFNHVHDPVPEEASRRLHMLARRRLSREPISHILGKREFWSLEFQVTAETLAPRPDSETLIEAVLAQLTDRDRPYRLIDLGTGTGCLLLALLSELPKARGIGVDRSQGVLAVARANAQSLGLLDRTSFLLSDWWEKVEGRFDVILSNPPYIPSGEIDHLDPEVSRFEPRLALDGGVDGLDPYRVLTARAPDFLTADGMVAFEVGIGQAEDIAVLLRRSGLIVRDIRRDLGGVERCVLARNEKSP